MNELRNSYGDEMREIPMEIFESKFRALFDRFDKHDKLWGNVGGTEVCLGYIVRNFSFGAMFVLDDHTTQEELYYMNQYPLGISITQLSKKMEGLVKNILISPKK